MSATDELRDLNARVGELDVEIADKTEKYEARLEALRADGKTLATIDDETASALSSEKQALDQLREERGKVADRRELVSVPMVGADKRTSVVPASRRSGSLAAAIFASDEYQAAKERGELASGRRVGFAVEALEREALQARFGAQVPLLATGVTGEALIPIDQQLIPPVPIPKRQVRVFDLINVGTTDSDLVRYGKKTVNTNAAAHVALAGALSESTYTWGTQDAKVKRLGHFVKTPQETLSDQGELDALLRGDLSLDLEIYLESQVVNGVGDNTTDGTDNFEGIIPTVINAGNTITYNGTNDTPLKSIHHAITTVRENLFADPTAIGMHPADYEQAILEQSSAGGFYSSPWDATSQRIWGLPVLVSTVFTQGQVLVGDYARGCTMWLRQGVTVEMTNSNEDDFKKNLVLVRAQMRAALAVKQPLAFCVIQGFGTA